MREGKKVKKRRQKADSTQGNPILEIEKEVKDAKYDKYREKHEDIVSLCLPLEENEGVVQFHPHQVPQRG